MKVLFSLFFAVLSDYFLLIAAAAVFRSYSHQVVRQATCSWSFYAILFSKLRLLFRQKKKTDEQQRIKTLGRNGTGTD